MAGQGGWTDMLSAFLSPWRLRQQPSSLQIHLQKHTLSCLDSSPLSWEHGLLVSVSIAVAALADCWSQRLAQPSLQSKSIKLLAHWPGPAPWAIMGRCFKHRRQGPPSKSGVEHLPGVQLIIENARHWAFWIGFLRQGGLAHQLRNTYV